MKEKSKKKYKLLIHCRLYQIRKGFEEYINFIPASFSVHYADLEEEGILSKLRFSPDIIIILLNEADSDFSLPLKVKLFAPSFPLLVILPEIPESYRLYLKKIGVSQVIQLPVNKEGVCKVIMSMLGL